MWNRDKYHIIWRAKNLIKNAKKRTSEYISQPQSKASTWNYIFHVTVHLPSNCYQLEPSLHSLPISKWHNLQLDKNYIFLIVISKKIFFVIAKNVLSSLFLLFILSKTYYTNDYLQNKKHNLSKNYNFSIILLQKLTIWLNL